MAIIMKMILLLLGNTMNTLKSVLSLFGELIVSILRVVSIGGLPAAAISVILISCVVYFLMKYILKAGKEVIIFVIASVVLGLVLAFSMIR